MRCTIMILHNSQKSLHPMSTVGTDNLTPDLVKSFCGQNSEIQMETRMWIGECLNCKVHTSARERMNYACSWSHLCMSERLPWHVTVKHNTTHAGYVTFLSITLKSKPFLMLKSVFRQHCFNTGPFFIGHRIKMDLKLIFCSVCIQYFCYSSKPCLGNPLFS